MHSKKSYYVILFRTFHLSSPFRHLVQVANALRANTAHLSDVTRYLEQPDRALGAQLDITDLITAHEHATRRQVFACADELMRLRRTIGADQAWVQCQVALTKAARVSLK